jgi:hypothetical protein
MPGRFAFRHNPSRARKTTRFPAVNYKQPSSVRAVEYTDERQPGWRFQAGAFTTEAEARTLHQAGMYGERLINVIPVHQTVEDWEWDR